MTSTTDKSPRTVKAIVARGRSIDVPVPGHLLTVGMTDDNKPVTRAPTKRYTAGQEIELPIEEVPTLMKLGYLADPDNPPPPVETYNSMQVH